VLCLRGGKNILYREEEEEGLFKAKARKEVDAGLDPTEEEEGFYSHSTTL
jgi:hypothetical protein